MPVYVSGGSRTPGSISYPSDHIRDVAAKILAQAITAQNQHDITWGQIQAYIVQDCNRYLQVPMADCLTPYAQRLRTSYDWLMNLANGLFAVADAIDALEHRVTQSFETPHPKGGPF